MANFLVFTCIKPIKRKFLGLFPLKAAAIFAAIFIAACGYYTYKEAEAFNKYDYFFEGLVDLKILLYIQLGVALLAFSCFLCQAKFYCKLVYLITLGLTGLSLVINLIKKSYFFEEYDEESEIILRWLYLIRIGTEFALELYSCYIAYSLMESNE